MFYQEKTAPSTNNSSAVQNEKTISQLLAELEQKFEVEKNAKNEAYYFILEMDLLDEFRKYCFTQKQA